MVGGAEPPLRSLPAGCRIQHQGNGLVVNDGRDESSRAARGVEVPAKGKTADPLDRVSDLRRGDPMLISDVSATRSLIRSSAT